MNDTQDPNLPLIIGMRKTELRMAALKHCVKWSAIVFMTYMAEQAVLGLAGHVTDVEVNVFMSILAKGSSKFCYLLGGGGLVWGAAERTIRRRTVKHMASRIRAREQNLDPHRTSSGLTLEGKPDHKQGGQ